MITVTTKWTKLHTCPDFMNATDFPWTIESFGSAARRFSIRWFSSAVLKTAVKLSIFFMMYHPRIGLPTSIRRCQTSSGFFEYILSISGPLYSKTFLVDERKQLVLDHERTNQWKRKRIFSLGLQPGSGGPKVIFMIFYHKKNSHFRTKGAGSLHFFFPEGCSPRGKKNRWLPAPEVRTRLFVPRGQKKIRIRTLNLPNYDKIY